MEDSYEEYRIGCAVRNEDPMEEGVWQRIWGNDIGLGDLVWI